MSSAGDGDFFCGGVDVAAAKQTIRQALRGRQRAVAPMHEDYDGDDDSLVSLLLLLNRCGTSMMC